MSMRSLIYFSRHGQTDWNISKRIQGQIERDITDFGREQAARNGRLLKELIKNSSDFDFVASPLRRTRETMEIIRGEMGVDVTNYRTDPKLMELNFGDWQGFTEEEIAKTKPQDIQARINDKWNFLPPGENAESYAMLAVRIQTWMKTVEKNTVCVTHGGCLRSILHLYGGLSEVEAANISIPQDKILKFDKNGLEWL
ncbi:histidine phosphatase family protein [Bartonella tamiae]|uniref:Alpha-ribazole phosphatase n=1 Tax=Bartonella tamiae Th239 TaxID=1094558 RepID=J0ZPK8_9HYPH|nr:histidine phosphatase family protein [Bartonella tamiae]EJF90518.1 hypothetical protein ME5_00919 [Bartonella tamiae Th239]EJF93538.1 hypothetical protein MEG_00962 [Bartonella tamiae Th307]